MIISGKTKIIGVFGDPIYHSLSPVMQNAAIADCGLDCIYLPFHVKQQDLAKAVDAIRALNMVGVNVTIPHKENIIEFLDEISEKSRKISSVNTIINKEGRLIGDTTDGLGFIKSAEHQWGDIAGSRVIVLGAGGSAKAVAFSLAEIGCNISIVNRTKKRAVELSENINLDFPHANVNVLEPNTDDFIYAMKSADIIVNTTSLGMYPNIDELPISEEFLHSGLMVYDLIYNPSETLLLQKARQKGAKVMNGQKMLVYQGAISFKLWFNKEPNVKIMEKTIVENM